MLRGTKSTFAELRTAEIGPIPWVVQGIHADGEFLDADGQGRRVAISLGPEHGTVGPSKRGGTIGKFKPTNN